MTDPGFDLHAYEPPISLWKLVEQHVPAHEQEEIRSMLGNSMIDQSLELHQEIETLLDIWRDYRDETQDPSNHRARLPEPPGLRDRLVQEIQFFVENVRDKAKSQGINADRLFQMRHNTDVIEYAMDTNRPASRCTPRPSTARSIDGRDTPMITTPTGSDRASAASTLSEEVESMNDKLNFLKFDEVVQDLRSTMEEEIETLMKDIRFLYECLDEEAAYRAEVQGIVTGEPTIAELQQERSKMEKELLSETINRPTPPQIKPAFKFQSSRKISTLGGDAKQRSFEPVGIGVTSLGTPNSPKGTLTGQYIACSVEESKFHQNHSDDSSVRGLKGNTVIDSTKVKTGPMKASHDVLTFDKSDDSYVKGTVQKSADSVSRSRDVANSKHGKVKHRTNSPARAKLVTVDMASDDHKSASPEPRLLPTPPPSARSNLPRPSSAQKFRQMVMQFRESS